ncbi:Aste57867_18454 [Aphanomyces stellatus]|uniref:Aste57867_18454 protein n=1 Tax=Aphanomyces stellatus TaxID=120398 RepID=A0A485LBX3_9STRA|nr:hypothetical protein As57867_018392 [Aphanomyces stellatus]VFT95190.1 Aste57867_18454 [Aphanomyces stellatus]
MSSPAPSTAADLTTRFLSLKRRRVAIEAKGRALLEASMSDANENVKMEHRKRPAETWADVSGAKKPRRAMGEFSRLFVDNTVPAPVAA